MKQTKNQNQKKPEKSTAARIFVLVMCVAILAGFIILPLLQ